MRPPPPSDSTELAEVLRRDRLRTKIKNQKSPQRHREHEDKSMIRRFQITQITPGDSPVTRVEDMIRTAVSFRSCRPTEVRNRNLRNLCNLRIYLRFSSCPLCLCGEKFASIRG